MSLQFFAHPPSHDRKPARPNKETNSSLAESFLSLQLNPEKVTSVEFVLQRLFQSLTVLGSTTDLALTGQMHLVSNPASRAQLHNAARQAEAAMHDLRDLQIVSSPVATELSQSLTVLVLAADMINQSQITGAEALSFYELLRRNADTTLRCLNQLCEYFELG